MSTHYDLKRVMKLEENRPHGFQVSSPQAFAWVLLL